MKKKKMLLSILAIVVVAVVLFLLFRNKTREGNSGGVRVEVGKSYKCQKNTHPIGEKNSTSNSLYRGDWRNKLKRYGSWSAAVQYGGKGLDSVETIDCKNLESAGVLNCNEDGKGTREYRGCKNKTTEGITCRNWDAGGGRRIGGKWGKLRNAGSRNHIAKYSDAKAKAYGTRSGYGRFRKANNFCRTPKEKHGDQEKKPWCYTSDYKGPTWKRRGWGYC